MFTDCFPVGILFLIKKLQKSKQMLIFAKIYCEMKCLVDILMLFVMSVVGFAGLPGAIISGVYFLTDAATDGFGLNKQ